MIRQEATKNKARAYNFISELHNIPASPMIALMEYNARTVRRWPNTMAMIR